MHTHKLKRGETFVLSGQALQDDGITPKALNALNLTAQVRDKNQALIADLAYSVIDNAGGRYKLEAPEGTSQWPIGVLYFDIAEVENGIAVITETVKLLIEQAASTPNFSVSTQS